MTLNGSVNKHYTKDVAKALNCTATTVRAYYKDKKFPDPYSEKRGRQIVYFLDDGLLDAYKKLCGI